MTFVGPRRLWKLRCATTVRIIAFLVLVGSHAACWPKNLGQRTIPVLDTCGYSDQVYYEDALLMRSPTAPTHFRLMVSRYVSMVQAMRGYRCTGTITVAFDGHHYLQTAKGDDAGLTELIPTLSRLSRLSIPNAYDVTILVVISLGLCVGYVGFCKLYPGRPCRSIGAASFVLLGLVEARVADVYIFQVSPLIAGIPWLLYFALTSNTFALTSSAALLAFFCACSSLVRSGTVVICASLLIALFLFRYRIRKALLFLVLLGLAGVAPVLFQKSLLVRRNVALARMGVRAAAPTRHALWHTAYLGLGFIPNSEVPAYRDDIAAAKVRSVDPTVAYLSSQYETVLRYEVWSILKRKPMIVIENLAAKAAIVGLLGLFLLFPAWKFIFAESELRWFDIAILLAAGVSAINALVAVPRLAYLLTFTCLCVLYSTIKYCRAGAQRTLDQGRSL